MGRTQWLTFFGYVVLFVLVGVTYFFSQTAIDRHRAQLPAQQYFDCLNKMANYDWNKFPGEKPSASEVCSNLASRQRM